MIVHVGKDPMISWREKFDGDPSGATKAVKKMNAPSSKMFKKVFKYIIGVNSQQGKIKMTLPETAIRK